MTKRSSVSNFMFRALCLGFSLIMLVMSLANRVRLMSLEEEIAELEAQTEIKETQTQILRVRLENRVSLAELEAYATGTLGMHRPTAEQQFFVHE